MIQQFALNIAILVSLSVISAIAFEELAKKKTRHALVQGLFHGLTAIFAMMHPVKLGEGLIFDARSVVLSLCAWFYGPLATLIALPLAAIYRWSLGGAGVTTGILTAAAAALTGLLLHHRCPPARSLPRAKHLLLFGFATHVLVVGIIVLTLPLTYARQIAPVFLLLYPLATLIAGKVLTNQYRLRETLHTLTIQNEHIRLVSEDLQHSLLEKNALLKEVHHRVKNNLQVITSLLRLEAARIEDPLSREAILDMQRRVRSMALLHETVYQSDSLARINMQTYFKKLAHQIVNTMSGRHTAIVPRLDLAPVHLPIEHAIPCGLLLNELLSNACKHAFPPETDAGEILVRLQHTDAAHLLLEVSDTGQGLPPDFIARRTHSLGLQLVDDLTRQLSGQLDILTSPRTAFRITFPLPSTPKLG